MENCLNCIYSRYTWRDVYYCDMHDCDIDDSTEDSICEDYEDEEL